MNMDEVFPGMEAVIPRQNHAPRSEDPPRLRRPDRRQALLQPRVLDELLPRDHPARIVWAVVEKWDLSGFYATIAARGEAPGRAATDRAAREKLERLQQALDEIAKMESAKAAQKQKSSRDNPPRASMTDAEARLMKLPRGG